ncbi:ATP-binding protein [Nocardioides sp.]|uniref:ATP-binding protein n=1 Tax=Nocardioides sp. TaxID=35761 RepID=UPI0039E3A2D9
MADREVNPYRPGFNQAPAVLAGRVDVLDGANEALEIAAFDGRTPRPLVLVGPRGLGKTVTLQEIASHAAARLSWPTVHVEATTGASLLDELTARLLQAERLLTGQTPRTMQRRRARVSGGKLEAKAFGVGGSVELEAVTAGDVDLAQALRQAVEAALARQAGLVITLDELQSATPGDLNVLGAVLQECVPEGWPLVVAIAALPALRNNRGPRRLPTYLERAEWHELEALADEEARQALVEPARQAGRPMTAKAAERLLDVAGGYPYAIQVAGHFAWRASHGADQISVAHARAAVPRIEKDLTQLFKGRWDDASPREREYLRALAVVARERAQGPTGGEVAAELGEIVTAVSYLRDRLLKKGTIYRDAAGRLHFITPGMGAWILTTLDEGSS